MEFFAFLFLVFIAVQVVKGLGKHAQTAQKLPPGTEPSAVAVGEDGMQVVRIGPLTLRIPLEAPESAPPPALAAPDPWWDEAHAEPEGPDVDAAVYAPESVALSVAPRPLPAVPAALDVEVDRDAEHARFHTRIDPPRRSPPARGLPRRTSSPLADLRDPAALRRAVVAAEILGPPRALRDLGD